MQVKQKGLPIRGAEVPGRSSNAGLPRFTLPPGRYRCPKALWLGPVQKLPKHGSVVWDMDMVYGLGAWQCGRLYPPQG